MQRPTFMVGLLEVGFKLRLANHLVNHVRGIFPRGGQGLRQAVIRFSSCAPFSTEHAPADKPVAMPRPIAAPPPTVSAPAAPISNPMTRPMISFPFFPFLHFLTRWHTQTRTARLSNGANAASQGLTESGAPSTPSTQGRPKGSRNTPESGSVA